MIHPPLLEQTIAALQQAPGFTPGEPVLAAMSGGVDSSVMAALLQAAGFQVVGVSMNLFAKDPSQESMGRCCTLDDFQDARRVAYERDFPHYVLDFHKEFHRTVIDPFIDAYLHGETPSPCILCNQHLKFDALLRKADELGIRAVATGHYARITHDASGWHLRKAVDAAKDQSYFLFHHTQATLARTLFPLSELSKPQVRALGAELGLHLAEKRESQEICFVGNDRYDAYIEREGRAPEHIPGEIRHIEDGRILGTHQGLWRYTIGQRKGLGIAHAEPLYVVRLEPSTNTVWVGGKKDLPGSTLWARDLHWCARDFPAPGARLTCAARIRSRSPEAPATLELQADGRARITFDAPQLAITPGQAIVFYQDDELLGGGWIDQPRPAESTE